jgi:hypothetical protein
LIDSLRIKLRVEFMGYISRRGKRPNEYASRVSHGNIIKDQAVKAFLAECELPKRTSEILLSEAESISYEPLKENPIRHIIAIDGGYNEVPVRLEFPSATVCFFQIGALIFSIEDLVSLDEKPFIDPEDIARLNQIQRSKLIIPIKNIVMKNQPTVTASIRTAIFNFFQHNAEYEDLMDTLKWFIFQEYKRPIDRWMLSSCPNCRNSNIPLLRNEISKECTFKCNYCGKEIYLTDVFRLHEAVDPIFRINIPQRNTFRTPVPSTLKSI